MKIGISEIDGQHQKLCEMLDEFYDACTQGKGADEVLRFLDFLGAYTNEHFKAEESLQREVNYPRYEVHKAQHDMMRQKITDLQTEIATWGATVPMVRSVNQTVTNWLIRHIMGFDMELKSYVADVDRRKSTAVYPAV